MQATASYSDVKIAYCGERHRLTGMLLTAIHQLNEFQAQQTHAIIDEDDDFNRFEDLLHMARTAKEQAKYALIAHIDQHQC
jgi:hypothetical protein